MRFRGLGFFPAERRPSVLWAGIQASANLTPLVSDIDAALRKLGVAREKRDFKPHLTLARFNPPGISEELRASVQAKPSREYGATRTGEFHLFESKTRPTGAVYTRLESFTFAKSEA
jgi:2'-5' RNA ligase